MVSLHILSENLLLFLVWSVTVFSLIELGGILHVLPIDFSSVLAVLRKESFYLGHLEDAEGISRDCFLFLCPSSPNDKRNSCEQHVL